MSTPRALAERAMALPYGSDTEHRRQDASTTPANITLAGGFWDVYNPGSVAVYVRHGAAVSVPASGGDAVAGQIVVPPNAVATFKVDGASAAVHVLTASGTATLELMRKPL